MKHFSEKIKTTNGPFNFYFNKINSQEEIYHISVIDKERRVQMFDMEEISGSWKIVEPQKCPSWIIDIENQLTQAISMQKEDKGGNIPDWLKDEFN